MPPSARLPSRRLPARLRNAAPVFAALGDPTRLALVVRLCGGAGSIAKLTAGSKVTRQAIAKHLQILAAAGLVKDTHRGREHIWEVETARLTEAGGCLQEISRQWDAALDRLKSLVEG